MDPVSAAGIALSVASLSFQVFAGCVKGFTILSTAGNFGKDASFLKAHLSAEEYRFMQWGDAVGLTESTPRILPRLNQKLAEELMTLLQDRLDEDKLNERYSLSLEHMTSKSADNGRSEIESSTPGVLAKAVSDERRQEILARANLMQEKNKLAKRIWWAVIDKNKFESLVRDIRDIVTALWNLLEPIIQRQMFDGIERTLSMVIKTNSDLEGLRGLQESLNRQHPLEKQDSIGSLSTAIELKVAREQLPPEDASGSSESVSGPASDTALSLDINLLKRPVDIHAFSGVYSAEYDGRPVLVEFKKAPPRMKAKFRARAKNLATLLSLHKQPSFLTLRCLGFLEDKDDFIFLYEYPQGSRIAASINVSTKPRSLQDILRDPKFTPPSVTTRLDLTLKICRTVLTVHTAGWLHKNIRSENIFFFPNQYVDTTVGPLEKPYLTGFTFSRANSPIEISDQASEDPLLDIYRHPSALGEPSSSYAMYMDLYSLGTVLIEISEWRPLKHIIKKCVDVSKANVDVPIASLAATQDWLIENHIANRHVEFRMGEIFGKGLRFLLTQDDVSDGAGRKEGEDLLRLQEFVAELSGFRV